MGRKGTGKNRLLDDDISDSGSEDSNAEGGFGLEGDEAAEFALNAQPYGNRKNAKRRKVDMFAGESEEDERPVVGKQARSNLMKTPKFVPSASSAAAVADYDQIDNLATAIKGQEPEIDSQVVSSGSEETASGSDMDQDDDQDAPIPAQTIEEPIISQSHAGIGARGGIGAKGGIGSQPTAAPSTLNALPPPPGFPSAFGAQANRPTRSFLSQPAKASPSTMPKVKLSAEEARHFDKLEDQGGVGFKLLAKMGWASGTGLGAGQQGRVTPVDSQLRPRNAGIGSGGFSERTKQAKLEARRRGEDIPEDDEKELSKGRRGAKKGKKTGFGADVVRQSRDGTPASDREAVWKKPTKPRKSKVEHLTYEEILQEAGDAMPIDQGVGQLIDLSGAALPSLASSLSLNVPVPTSDTTRLPELRHNVQLIVDTAKGELVSLGKEGKAVQEKRKWIDSQAKKATAKVSADSSRIARLQQITSITEELNKISSSSSVTSAPIFSKAFSQLENCIGRLIDEFPTDYDDYNLDEAVVASMAPLLRSTWMDWDPLENPDLATRELKKWRKAFRMNRADPAQTNNGMQVDVFGAAADRQSSARVTTSASMTAYESLLWTHWLPRVRSAINNSWSAADPSPAIAFFSAWAPVLPHFLHDNVLDQLILPKISKAVSDWTPKSSVSLHTLVLPWIEIAGPRMEEMVGEAKRRIKSWLKTWRPRDGVPQGFSIWRDVYTASEWDDLMLRYVVPQLGTTIRDKFQINPRNQNLEALERVTIWATLLRSSIMDQLLETEFFSKWLEALYVWLTSEPNYQQVTEWYLWWKSYFEEPIASSPGVSRGFMKGLDLMNNAMSLGDDAKYRLRRADTNIASTVQSKPAKKTPAVKAPVAEVSFRSLVEEHAAENNLVFLPTGKSHQSSGQVLFRVSKNVDGKSGITVYLHDDIVWVQESTGQYSPIGLQEMVERAQRLS